MDRYIFVLVLLILIASGTLYICTQNTLEHFSNSCLGGCRPATVVTGNCKPAGSVNNNIIHSCPQECYTLNIGGAPNTCSYDIDCQYCKKSLLLSNGQPYNPPPPTGGGTIGTPPPIIIAGGSPSPSPSGAPSPSPFGLPSNIPKGLLNLPSSSVFTVGKSGKGSTLCPAATVVILNN